MDKSSKFISMEKRVVKTKLQKRETRRRAAREKAATIHNNRASSLKSMRMAKEPRPRGFLRWNETLSTLGEIGGRL